MIIISAAAAGIYFGALKTLEYFNHKNNLLPEVALNRNAALTAADGNNRNELTEKEIIKTFNRAREHFVENRDNNAQIEINRTAFFKCFRKCKR